MLLRVHPVPLWHTLIQRDYLPVSARDERAALGLDIDTDRTGLELHKRASQSHLELTGSQVKARNLKKRLGTVGPHTTQHATHAMLAAHAVRVISADRIVVCINSTQSMVELQLEKPLSPEQLAKARCYVGPFKPLPLAVRPGQYRAGVFWDSEIGALEFAPAGGPRVQYKKPPTCNLMRAEAQLGV